MTIIKEKHGDTSQTVSVNTEIILQTDKVDKNKKYEFICEDMTACPLTKTLVKHFMLQDHLKLRFL